MFCHAPDLVRLTHASSVTPDVALSELELRHGDDVVDAVERHCAIGVGSEDSGPPQSHAILVRPVVGALVVALLSFRSTLPGASTPPGRPPGCRPCSSCRS